MKKKAEKFIILFKKVVTSPYSKKDSLVIAALLLLLASPIFIVTTTRGTNLFGRAASSNTIEAENGTFSGNVTILSDTNASGGKYVKMGSIATTPSATPSSPLPTVTSRNKYLWPFSSSSIWNMPIGSNAQFADPKFQTPREGYGIDEEVINLDPNGSLRNIALHSWPASCPGLSTWNDTPQTTATQVRITDSYITDKLDGLYPNMGGGFLNTSGRIQEVNYATRCTVGGQLFVGSSSEAIRGTLDLLGDGLESSRGQAAWGAHGGSMLSGVGGSIRKGELLSSEPIRHVVKVNLDLGFYGKLSGGVNSHVWPAFVADAQSSQIYGACSDGVSGNEIVPMGALLAIPATTDINTLALETAPAKKLAWTLQNYGAYVVDNDGGGNCNWWHRGLMTEYGVQKEMTAAGISLTDSIAWQRDMDRLFKALRMVTNNSSSTIGGGGTPRQPLAPPLAN